MKKFKKKKTKVRTRNCRKEKNERRIEKYGLKR